MKRKNKRFLAWLLSAALIVSLLPCIAVQAETSIKIGDCVKMGTYFNEPIIWKCIAFEKIKGYDNSGNPIVDPSDRVEEYTEGYLPLMLSTHIICFKAYDVPGDNTTGSHGRGYSWKDEDFGFWRRCWGNNYWGDSNIRCWLNSDTNVVEFTCGNPPNGTKLPYDTEQGFLRNFSNSEKANIQKVSHKVLLDRYEYNNQDITDFKFPLALYRDSSWNSGTDDFNAMVANFDEYYGEYYVDTIMLPSITIGYDCKHSIPTSNAYEEYKNCGSSYFKERNDYDVWLMDASYVSSENNSSKVATACAYNYPTNNDMVVIGGTHSKSLLGIRPMFYLKDNTFFSSGSGIESDPYTVDNNDSYTPATEAPTPTPQPTSLKIYCNEPSLSTTVGNSFLIGAALTDEDGNYSSASGITFDVEDSGILKAVKTTDDENTRYITFNAVGTGTTTIKITDGKSWQTAELPFTVNKASANAYTIYNIPNIGSDDANFYNFTGLYIDSFKVKNKSNGSAELSFDVYNQNPTYGTVEVYDNSGELIDAEIIGKTAFETSIVSIWGTVTEIGKDISEGVYNPMSYKSSIQSKKTEIRNLSVPAGGYIKISVDTRESSVCGIINALDLISQTSGLVSNAKKQEDVPKTAIEKLKNNGNKFLEQYQTKFVKELTNKTIGSTDDLTSYLSNIANMFLNGDLRELAVSVLASSAVGTAESAVMDWLKQAGNPAQAGLSAFWKISKIDNLIYQTAMFAKRANCGSITIQVPDGNVRRCSDITVKCTMNNNTAVEVCRTDINSSLLATIKNLNKNIFGSSQIIGYDINLVEDGEVIQPDGTAEVTINIPEWMQSGKNISVYRAENDGSVTDMNGKVSGDAITFETDHFSTYILSADGIEVDPPETAEGQTLVNGDTIVSDWAAEEVQEAFDEELVPDILHGADLTKKVDRAEFAAIAVTLYENLSKKTAQPGENPFGDISGNYCKDDILKAYNLGITNGITNVTFEPSTLISREQVATMLTRAYKKSEFPNWTLATDGDYPLNYMGVTKYADDNEISDYAKESVYFMTRWDILNGIDDSHFAPKNNTTLGESYGYATREQAVVIALRSAKHL